MSLSCEMCFNRAADRDGVCTICARVAAPATLTLEHALSTFAYHVTTLASERPAHPSTDTVQRLAFGLGFGEGCPSVFAEVIFTPSQNDTDPWGVWAQGTVNGVSCGNRCGVIREYARLCTPIFAHLGKVTT